ncbi:MAG: hypothetical protein A2166_03970 [Omnitrophica WOR_2 bacterium RBG_13_41_10]|nr:MAG: hypothetical protein A2166_03970 [Omnitrophica WOR_2 bacterium RBG_13_41_10]
MKKKTSVVLLVAITLSFYGFAFAETEKEKAAKEFQELKADFETEISYPPYSDYTFTNKYWNSESGQKIIAMGKRALPFIMEEIKNGKSWFVVAAERITGIKMRGPEADDLTEQWLDWWEENKEQFK